MRRHFTIPDHPFYLPIPLRSALRYYECRREATRDSASRMRLPKLDYTVERGIYHKGDISGRGIVSLKSMGGLLYSNLPSEFNFERFSSTEYNAGETFFAYNSTFVKGPRLLLVPRRIRRERVFRVDLDSSHFRPSRIYFARVISPFEVALRPTGTSSLYVVLVVRYMLPHYHSRARVIKRLCLKPNATELVCNAISPTARARSSLRGVVLLYRADISR